MFRQSILIALCTGALLSVGCDSRAAAGSGSAQQAAQQGPSEPKVIPGPEELATFAGGCFWCMEPPFEDLTGVRSVISGYTGGPEVNPTYRQVSSGATGHTEAVQINFNPDLIGYDLLLQVYWRSFDPTDGMGQFADRGTQYRPGIFFHDEEQKLAAQRSRDELQASGRFKKPIAAEITSFGDFYPAEDYHQDYYKTNPKEYKAYAVGSGRKGFLERVWGDEEPLVLSTSTRYSKPSGKELRVKLSSMQFKVTQKNGTEPPFRNEYWDNKAAGIYVDVVSGEPLFSSVHKYKSGTGWPSFDRPLVEENIVDVVDRSLFRERTEVRSKHGDSHLGHVFKDGPKTTGLRYCINSASLRFVAVSDLASEGYGEFVSGFQAPVTASADE